MFAKKSILPLGVPARLLIVLIAVVVLGFSPMLTAREGSVADQPETATELFGDPMTLHLDGADIHDVLNTFSMLTGIEFVVDPEVSGNVTVRLDDVPWDKALDLILREHGLSSTVMDGRIHVGKAKTLETVFEHHQQPKIEGEFEGRPLYRYVEEGAITEPKRVDGPNPRYPEQARKEGINGVVLLECVIGEDGSVREVEVVQSNANVLSEAAIEAVEQWTFEPATLEEVPVAVRYILTVKFRLQ